MPRPSLPALMCSASILTLSTAFGPGPALAQEGGAVMLDPIIITGETRDRDLRETASSVSVLSGDALAQTDPEAGSVAEVVNGIPNVTYPGTVAAPVIRGVDSQGPNSGAVAFFSGTVPRATINVDGHYQGYNEFLFGASSIWDVESIEVFRGPQTTSQGANAIAGAIIVNTKDPTFTPELAFRAEGGSYAGRRASVAVSGPLSDSFAARIALDYSARDTFIDYVNPDFADDDADQDFESFTGRAKLLWQPAGIPGLEAKLTYARSESNRPTFEAASPPYDDLDSIGASLPSWDQTTDTGILDVDYDLGNGIVLFNQLQYSETEAHRITGLEDAGDADITGTNYSYEGRVTFGETADTLSGVAGVYAARTETDETLYLRGVSTFDDTKTNLGLFGETTWRFAERWSVTGALRFQQDRVRREGDAVYAPESVDYDNTFTAILPKLSLAYELTPEIVLGGLVSRGYNPGGVSLNFTTGEWTQFDEEQSWNYELFTRAALLQDRMFVNANLFYTEYEDYQLNIPVEISPGLYQSYTINAEQSRAYGMELAVDYQARHDLWLAAGAGFTWTELQKVRSNPDYEGNTLADAPDYTLSLSAKWDVTDRIRLGGQVRYVDGYYADLANSDDLKVDGYTITDINAAFALSDNLEIYGYVSNLFDEREPVDLQTTRGTDGSYVSANMTAPRMVGLGIRGSF
ncbi:TonB-dependent receptor [Mangrovicoccus algicola]|uniref:TonB-dependent receptor n=1 Tax=Mangrovicoccus algicola TaxID=2771008 RepID=A0A8J6YSX4_9RHOB|nr:TonB-dependent receptor [Mangrovicoccus algicola]MBE3638568.1 TonB-dependent receptor [Mangrovicoccus algicola]